MRATHHHGAAAPGGAKPERPHKDEVPGLADAEGFKEQDKANSSGCQVHPASAQALRVIEGERTAAAYVGRLQAQQADPDELAVIVSMPYGTTLRGFCAAIAKALGKSAA